MITYQYNVNLINPWYVTNEDGRFYVPTTDEVVNYAKIGEYKVLQHDMNIRIGFAILLVLFICFYRKQIIKRKKSNN